MTATTLTKSQFKTFGPKPFPNYGKGCMIRAKVRFDDECGNGHNTFSVTGEIYVPGRNDIEAGGCLHTVIAKAFPELAPLIKWHLVSTDGPMHYVANTTYHASDKDHRGLGKGEKRQIRNGKTNLPVWQIVARRGDDEVPTGDRSWVDSAESPPDALTVGWEPVWIEGEGKNRDLDAARSSAVWPDATDDELTAPGLKERLEARLPALLAEFRAAVESLGFTW